MNIKKKTSKGITLIALVITIIVLLILAGVTLGALTGDNGILTRAADSKEKTEIADIKEELQRKILEEQITNDGDLTKTALETILKSKGTLSDETDILDRKLKTTKGNYEIPVRDIWNGTLSSTSGGGGGTGLTDTADTKPGAAMPSGATVIEADSSKGIVIKDSKNNEWVWIEVPKTTVFTTATASNQYDNIKADLIAYASNYRSEWTDEWYAKDEGTLVTASTANLTDAQKALNNGCGLNYAEYDQKYKSMLSSVYTNGGFWIGRYEAGISGSDTDMTKARKSHSNITNDSSVAVSKADMIPYNYVYCSEAQTLASKMSTDSSKTSSLMFGIQWDLVCKYLEGKDGLEKDDINSNSYSWGNYADSQITNLSGKYAIYSQSSYTLGSWKTIPDGYTKPNTGTENWVLLSTGASEYTKKMNIYDFAGNEWEWTLENTSGTDGPCAIRGGLYYCDGSSYPASGRGYGKTSYSRDCISFRPSLY